MHHQKVVKTGPYKARRKKSHDSAQIHQIEDFSIFGDAADLVDRLTATLSQVEISYRLDSTILDRLTATLGRVEISYRLASTILCKMVHFLDAVYQWRVCLRP